MSKYRITLPDAILGVPVVVRDDLPGGEVVCGQLESLFRGVARMDVVPFAPSDEDPPADIDAGEDCE